MKPVQHANGTVRAAAEKKPQAAVTPLSASSASGSAVFGHSVAEKSFGSPSAAVWNRYIDSRMKQFSSR